jgi:hypothetical protein
MCIDFFGNILIKAYPEKRREKKKIFENVVPLIETKSKIN